MIPRRLGHILNDLVSAPPCDLFRSLGLQRVFTYLDWNSLQKEEEFSSQVCHSTVFGSRRSFTLQLRNAPLPMRFKDGEFPKVTRLRHVHE